MTVAVFPFEFFGPLKGDPALGDVPGVLGGIDLDLHRFNCTDDKTFVSMGFCGPVPRSPSFCLFISVFISLLLGRSHEARHHVRATPEMSWMQQPIRVSIKIPWRMRHRLSL
jgi:hypothetical protein